MVVNCSKTFCRFSAISRASWSGGGRFWVSSRLSSSSQKMPKLALSFLLL
jgi:hypothetical protein